MTALEQRENSFLVASGNTVGHLRTTGKPRMAHYRLQGELRGKRLMPKIPFVLSGEYALDNLWAGSPIEGLSFKASIYKTIRDLPDGTKVRLKVKG